MIKLRSLSEIRNSYEMILEPYVGTMQSFLSFLKSLYSREGIERLFSDKSALEEAKFIVERIRFNLDNNDILTISIKFYLANVEDHFYASYFLQELEQWHDDFQYITRIIEEIEQKSDQFSAIRDDYNSQVAYAILDRQAEANIDTVGIWIRNIDTRLDGRKCFYELEDFVTPYTEEELCAM